MERGVYFDAWYPLQHNYHPSLPPRRLRMIDHLEDYRATMLVWAALGGGVLSLPYLDAHPVAATSSRKIRSFSASVRWHADAWWPFEGINSGRSRLHTSMT